MASRPAFLPRDTSPSPAASAHAAPSPSRRPEPEPEPELEPEREPVSRHTEQSQMNGVEATDGDEKRPTSPDATMAESKAACPDVTTATTTTTTSPKPSSKAPELLATRSPPPSSSLPSADKPTEAESAHRKPDRDKADQSRESLPTSTETPVKSSRRVQAEDSNTRRNSAPRPQSESHTGTENATTTATTTRKQTNGTIGSVYSGNKIRHLKKDDGIPLWRKDIQYRFLRCVFEDKTPCFTRFPEGDKNHTFADIYLDAMAKSSKTSKILKDKLQNERSAAINMAMVCLLVNFGRMNTTLNFFPEMRAQLRTYHSIPSLQAHQDSSAYKQLQDAPRLKSILKGASEDVEQPGTIEKIKNHAIPRTNPVNLIFVLSHYAPRISELHFPPPGDFFDLVMRPTLSSKSRARAFLWLMWYYLESDFSEKAALENPFGPGTVGEGSEGLPLKVPEMQELTEEEAEAENVDPPEEIQYGENKQRERKRILEEDDVIFRHVKRPRKDYASDDQASEDVAIMPNVSRGGRGGRRSDVYASTPLNPAKRALEDEDLGEGHTPQTSRARVKRPKRDSSVNRPPGSQPQRLVLKTRMDQTPDTSSPAPPGAGHPILNQYVSGDMHSNGPAGSRRPRPMTQHQIALEQNRKQRVDYVLAQRRMDAWNSLRTRREKEVPFARAGRLLQSLPTGYDTDDENSWGKGGICPKPEEEEDYGEAASFYFSMIRKVARRLQRWDWDSVLSDDKDYPANGLGGEYNRRAAVEHRELEVISQPMPIANKPRSRPGPRRERKAVENAADLSKETGQIKKPAGRAGASALRKSSAEKAGSKRSRPRARLSKVLGSKSAATEEHDQVETPEASMIADQDDKDTERGEDTFLEEADKDILSGESPHDTRSRLDDASSIGVAPEPAQGVEDDTEELSDVDMEVSKLAESGYTRGDSLSPEDGMEASRLDDDETMLEA
ncbi:hypothetical protein CPC735_019140 [Coccidioides posadasii C735 delta SOWgp]|uniref:INO80 chromatin remodeling complex Ies1 n=2 Tax=Coccidioides posadasii TaxID=199306 RepID=A0A0J6FT01_COCPO|nr:hypothetical protein CPC735_019140 [Coccidioides posadasii C735 delta SOWgp]EER25310.1 hypothetical protein CPC735_019140 [Coccidioides posadasii C735 delta SOWgp]KMM72204.1 INO80 chromatin remodeling complex Ies1 [Coccidioides posadasii RMSCC 3488]|eukprot:XP_003067455.1 hypothetical protein CPC735_019140 [Coccidioides posadasii C735 delta SOWgp]